MEKYEVVVNDNITLVTDGMAWEYPQTDGAGSGATDENVMIREVLPERDKISLRFDKGKTEAEIRQILAVRSLDECTVNFYDLRAGARLTKTMYPAADTINAHMLVNGEFVCEPFEMRFIQTIPD
jgi:hypothetical protein